MKVKRRASFVMGLFILTSFILDSFLINIRSESNLSIYTRISGIDINLNIANNIEADQNLFNLLQEKSGSNYTNIYSESNPLKISSAAQLAAFSESVNSGRTFEGEYVKIEDSNSSDKKINLNGNGLNILYEGGKASVSSDSSGMKNVWNPIGRSGSFNGTFDGNGYEIDSMICYSTNGTSGFFGTIGSKANVKNLGIGSNCYSILEGSGSTSYIGVFAGNNSGVIENVYNKGKVIFRDSQYVDGTNYFVGGLSAQNTGTIKNSYNDGDCLLYQYSSSPGGNHRCNYYMGGITSNNNGGEILTCYNNGRIFACTGAGGTTNTKYYNHVGGIAGYNSGDIINSYNSGGMSVYTERVNINGKGSSAGYVGGISGKNDGSGKKVDNCYNSGVIFVEKNSTASQDIGGIVGVNSQTAISNCLNLGLILPQSQQSIGGF